MPDFIVNNSSISCIDLKINNILWPNNYSNANNEDDGEYAWTSLLPMHS